MIVILDTNVIFGAWMLRTPEAQALLDFIKKTDSTILIPKIVWAEIRKNYKEAFTEKHDAYVKASKYFSSVLIDKVDFVKIDTDLNEQVDNYLKWLHETLWPKGNSGIIEYDEQTLEKVSVRALEHRRPFNSTNQREFKDSLVWQAVLDTLEKGKYSDEEEVVLISKDIDAFGAEKGNNNLHPDLKIEIDKIISKSFASNFYYHTDLKAFLNTHNTLISGITIESITSYLEGTESNFAATFSSVINNSTNYITAYIKADFPGIYFPSLEEDIHNANYSDISPGGDFFLYKYQTGKSATIFCNKRINLSAVISYSTEPNLSNILSTTKSLSFETSLSISYNETFERITVDNISLLSLSDFELPKPINNFFIPEGARESLIASVLKVLYGTGFEDSINKKIDLEELDWTKSFDLKNQSSSYNFSKRPLKRNSNFTPRKVKRKRK